MAPLTFEQSMQKFLADQQKEREQKQKQFEKGQEALKEQQNALEERITELKNATDDASVKLREKLDQQIKSIEKESDENVNAREREERGANDIRSQQKIALDEQKSALDVMRSSIEANGGVAADSKEFQKQELKLKLAELDLRKKQATSRGAKEEIEKERRAAMAKQGSFLQKIAAGIGGMKGLMLEKAKAVGGGLMNILKGTLFAGLFLALAAFFQSPMFGKVIDVLTNTILPAMVTVGEFFYNIGARFFKAFENIQKDFDTAFGEGDQSFFERVKAFFGMFFEGGIIGIGLAGLTTLVFGFGPLKFLFRTVRGLFRAFRGVGTDVDGLTKDINKQRKRTRGRTKGKFGRLFQATKSLVTGGKDLAVRGGQKVTSVAKTGVKTAATAAKTTASTVANTGAKAMTGLKAGAKSGARMLAGAARFIPGAGLAVTAAMGIFDGVSAGVEEFKKSGSIGKAVKEGLAGTVSGLTFGLVDQKTVSGAFDFIGNTFKKGIDKIKSDTMMGVEKMQALLADPVKFDEEIETRKASIKRLQQKIDKGGFRNVGISSADEKAKIRALQEEINGLRRTQLEQNAKMKSGSGAAPNVNINAPSDNKVTNSTSNTTSNNTMITNSDPIVSMAMGADF